MHLISIKVIFEILGMSHCIDVHYFIYSFHYNTLCLFIHNYFLIFYTCIYKLFVPGKCSICLCFIACHNSLFFVCTLLNLFSLCIWQPFIWSCIPTYDLLLVFPRVLFRFSYQQKFILYMYLTPISHFSLLNLKTSERQLILC